jgi:hypothetical protein
MIVLMVLMRNALKVVVNASLLLTPCVAKSHGRCVMQRAGLYFSARDKSVRYKLILHLFAQQKQETSYFS